MGSKEVEMKIQNNTEFLYPVKVIKHFDINNPDNDKNNHKELYFLLSVNSL